MGVVERPARGCEKESAQRSVGMDGKCVIIAMSSAWGKGDGRLGRSEPVTLRCH